MSTRVELTGRDSGRKEHVNMMPKSDTIDAIRRLNPTASPDFLVGFSNDELSEYLERLSGVSAGRTVRGFADMVELEEPTAVEDLMIRTGGTASS